MLVLVKREQVSVPCGAVMVLGVVTARSANWVEPVPPPQPAMLSSMPLKPGTVPLGGLLVLKLPLSEETWKRIAVGPDRPNSVQAT